MTQKTLPDDAGSGQGEPYFQLYHLLRRDDTVGGQDAAESPRLRDDHIAQDQAFLA